MYYPISYYESQCDSQNYETIFSSNCDISSTTELTILKQPTDRSTISKVAWVANISGPGNEFVTTSATDSNNNVIIGGIYQGDPAVGTLAGSPTNFYNSDNTIGKIIYSSGNYDTFIAKYDPCGYVGWVSKIVGTSKDTLISISIDINNNIIVTGFYSGRQLVIYNSSDQIVASLPSIDSISSFIIKYDVSGNPLWVNAIVSTSVIIINSVAIDITNNIFITGYYNSTIVNFYNPNNTIGSTLPLSVGNEAFIAKYNSSGHIVWSTRIGNNGSANPNNVISYGISVSLDGSIVVTGSYQTNSLLFYNAPNGSITSEHTLENTNTNTTDVFIAKYTTLGKSIWATRIAGASNDFGISITVDNLNNIVVVGGYISQPVTIYSTPNGSKPSLVLSNNGQTDIFVAKYDPAGIAIWSTKISGSGGEISQSVTTDTNNNIIVTGFFTSRPLIIYNSNGTAGPTLNGRRNITNNNSNSFLIKYDKNGRTLWAAKQMGSNNSVGMSVSTDYFNDIILVGSYTSNTFLIYNSSGAINGRLDNYGQVDSFIIKYSDFSQVVKLQPSLLPYFNKKIILKGYRGTNSLITATLGLLSDSNGRNVVGIILMAQDSEICLRWSNNVWTIISSIKANIMYPQ
ncbi:putative WD repeat-containing protein [Tupanvirus soda lake]|uniref:WD repeat-containing protein n=2 Tax=Tupanvirus TaxID=2094720 RepID=A0AC62ACY8_9VIRU|nr:putative WD repeat-containing protein [Tupanvirus soda lake]QKU35505.1 putative WD repeat-containing protein [Tupanvirus soda lake]